jgi:hypothetical protein
METIAFGNLRNPSSERAVLNHSRASGHTMEDIVTIDAQIDLKVRRDTPEAKMLNAATEFMEKKMLSFLAYEFEQFKAPAINLDGVLNFGRSSNPAFEELKRFHLQKFSEMGNLKTRAHRRNKLLFSIEPGFEIIIPPYDSEWTNDFVSFSGANKVAGSFKSFPDGNGFGASGIGVFLSPVADVSVRFSVHGPVSYSWSNFVGEGGGYAASRGGIGVTVYNASTGMLVKDEHEVLWSQSKCPKALEISGGSDDLFFQHTAVGNSYFKMRANHTYLVWMWSWAFADSEPNAAAFANIDAKIPFMIVDSSTL